MHRLWLPLEDSTEREKMQERERVQSFDVVLRCSYITYIVVDVDKGFKGVRRFQGWRFWEFFGFWTPVICCRLFKMVVLSNFKDWKSHVWPGFEMDFSIVGL